ncbi:hypothetical protein HK104_003068 [Borealophlyctis nickersoniae]|nr:hypothetical protein HK104_003068 [Borealophlyctis nickersoniae]
MSRNKGKLPMRCPEEDREGNWTHDVDEKRRKCHRMPNSMTEPSLERPPHKRNESSASNRGKRKFVRANDLATFTSPERYLVSDKSPPRRSPQKITADKRTYLNANFRFLVKANGDYSRHLTNPDLPVADDDIENVVKLQSESVHCPICLGFMRVSRYTPCGHVFCYWCILRHLVEQEPNVTETTCPLCKEFLEAEELKSIRVRKIKNYQTLLPTSVPSPSATEPLTAKFRLMRCDAPSTVALPRTSYDPDRHRNSLPTPDDPDALTFSRLVVVQPSWVKANVIEPQLAVVTKVLGERRTARLKEGKTGDDLFVYMAWRNLEKKDMARIKEEIIAESSLAAFSSPKDSDQTHKEKAKSPTPATKKTPYIPQPEDDPDGFWSDSNSDDYDDAAVIPEVVPEVVPTSSVPFTPPNQMAPTTPPTPSAPQKHRPTTRTIPTTPPTPTPTPAPRKPTTLEKILSHTARTSAATENKMYEGAIVED